MALREGTRRWGMRLSWAALLVAGTLLAALRVGRPLYYTDGARELSGAALAGAGMLRWGTPEVVAEIPGPVAGRIAELPDGRLLYGRLGADGTADLVLWQPATPEVPPEPVFGLNTPHHELAPAIAADGSVWFASDRPGGAGGYDLWRAPHLRAPASAVEPVAACNTARDETDPAPHPGGGELVFVRSERRGAGDDGVLLRWRLGGALDPAPVFAAGARAGRTVDRDPAWSADGAALWFVRQEPRAPLRLVRSSLLGGAFDAPVVVGSDWGGGELRSPAAAADGRRLGLLQARPGAGAAVLWYSAAAHEVYPWWPGQRWLEWLLLGIAGSSLLLLVLLHLGRRWSTLDLVAQCLLLSLLLHLLLFLWLMGVAIPGALQPGDDDDARFEVQVVAAGAVVAEAGGSDVGAAVRFAPAQRSLAALAPPSEPVRAAARLLAAATGEWSRDVAARALDPDPALADAVPEPARRDGTDAATPVAAAELGELVRSAAEHAARHEARREAAPAGVVEVQAPGPALLRRAPERRSLAAAAERAAAPGTPPFAFAEPAAPELRDDGGAPAVVPRAGADALPPAPALAAAAAELAPAPPIGADAAVRAVAAAVPDATAAAPPSGLPRAARAPLLAASPFAAAPGGVPSRTMPRRAPALRDAPVVPPAAVGAAAAAAVAASVAPAPDPGAAIAGPAAGAVAVVRGAAAPGPSDPALPHPAAALVRPTRAAASAPVAAAPPPAPRALATPSPLRSAEPGARTDGPAAVASPAGPPPARPELPATLRPDPAANPIDRPRRHAGFAGLAPAPEPVAPPPTRLVRARGAVAAAAAGHAAPPLVAGAYSNRFGPAKAKAIETFGGSDDTERAVRDGLRYLARIQHDDGSWGDRDDYDRKYGFVYVGKTALCLLAFLGAGHTPQSGTEHREVVAKALAHLLALQDADTGAFGPSSCYGHGIATYALAECYGLTKDPALLRPLEAALTWILDHQGPRRDRRNRGGWGYFSPGLAAEDDYARVSVTAWMVMALESARLSGVELPDAVLPAAREYLELSYDQPNGWFRYNHKPSRLQSAWPTLPASTPAAAFCLLLLGSGADDPKVAAALDYTVDRRPERYRRYGDDDFVLRGQGNVYFWYYGTLCCFLAGGEAWERWNERLRTVLPAAQARDGSFPPIDVYAAEAGDSRDDRSYTTAMCVLCLEVYYRYFTPLLLGR